MKTKLQGLVLFLVANVSCAISVDVDDERLKEDLKTIFTDIHSVKWQMQETIASIHYASNRLVSAAKSVYADETSDSRQKRRALTAVSSYGSPNDADFLVSCATNKEFWSTAALGTLALQGPTSDTVDKITQLMQINHNDNGVDVLEQDKGWVVQCLLQRATSPAVLAEDRDRVWQFALSFATNHVNLAVSMDASLKSFNPAYAHSRTRKGLLLHWQSCTGKEYCKKYVMRELVDMNAIPDSELNE